MLNWVDKYSPRFPELHIWKKQQERFLRLSEDDCTEEAKRSASDKFEDKYQQLKIYKVIFLRNKSEVEKLFEDF